MSEERPDTQRTAGPWQERLGLLMAELVEGTIEPDRRDQIVEILESSDAAKRYYLSYIQVHAELEEQWGGGQVRSPLSNSVLAIPDSESSGEIAAPHHVSLKASLSKKTIRSVGWLLVGMAVSAMFFWALLRIESPSGDASHSHSSVAIAMPPSNADSGGDFLAQMPRAQDLSDSMNRPDDGAVDPATDPVDVAVVVRSDGIDDPMLQIGKRLTPGMYRFDQGTIQLEFMSGATMVVAGPAELKIDSEKKATLITGTARMRVSERAKGFVLNTPDAAVVDIGTEFGLRFDKQGHPEVDVIEGEVEFSMLGNDGNTLMSRRLKKSQRMSRDESGVGKVTRSSIAEPDALAIDLPRYPLPGANERYASMIIEDQPLIYWRFNEASMQLSDASGPVDEQGPVDGSGSEGGRVANEMGERWSAQIVDQDPSGSGVAVEQGHLRWARTDSNRYLTTTDPIVGLDSGAFTIEVWINPDDIEHAHYCGVTPFDTREPMAFLSVLEIVTDTFLIHQPASLRALYRNPPERKVELGRNVFSPGMVTPGQWHHVVVVKSQDKLGMFLNGVLIREVDSQSGQGESQNEFRVILGQLSMVYRMRQFSGLLDEFALYDRELQPAEIERHFQAALNPSR